MATTLEELKEHLRTKVDPNDLVEYLNMTSDQLVDRFGEEIELRMDWLVSELELEEQDDEARS